MTTKNISLVLGSGGARGLAHIGVIHWLEENGLKIESISGCSMGALIGGIYAAGNWMTLNVGCERSPPSISLQCWIYPGRKAGWLKVIK